MQYLDQSIPHEEECPTVTSLPHGTEICKYTRKIDKKKDEENKRHEYGKKTKSSENDVPTAKQKTTYFRIQYGQKTKCVFPRKVRDINSLSKFVNFQVLQ